jgi:hypothetical protein
MHYEYPVHEIHARTLVNRPAGVVLLDGTVHYGVITKCEKGSLVLNPYIQETGNEANLESVGKRRTARKGSVRTKGRRSRHTSTSVLPPPYPPVPYGPPFPPFGPPFGPPLGPPIALDLLTIALLFALLP